MVLQRGQAVPVWGTADPGEAVMIGDTAFEREWLAAGRFGGYIAADTYFPGPAGA